MNIIGKAANMTSKIMNVFIYSKLVGKFILLPFVRRGIIQHQSGIRTNPMAYRAMRKLFGNKDASLYSQLLEIGKEENSSPIVQLECPGLAKMDIQRAVSELRQRGFFILSELLDEEKCAALEEVALKANCQLIDSNSDDKKALFLQDSPIAVRYEVDESDVLECPIAQEIICDRSLLQIAREYLESEPVQDLVTMWWSTSFKTTASSSAAQLFHFDLDRLKFLKLFIYLSDVTATNGPHSYIAGSHVGLPAALRRDERHTDTKVKSYFPSEEVIITGKRGLMFLADTRGLHKGVPLIEGCRLIFQIEYANSLFGAPYLSPKLTLVSEEMKKLFEENPFYLQRFIL